jgi:hypothetical protein
MNSSARRTLVAIDLDEAARAETQQYTDLAIAEEHTAQHVGNMTSQALNELRQQRDETDALMEAIKKNDKLLQAAINEHAQRVSSVIASKVIIAEQLGHLRELFAPVTPVLTQLNGGTQANLILRTITYFTLRLHRRLSDHTSMGWKLTRY